MTYTLVYENNKLIAFAGCSNEPIGWYLEEATYGGWDLYRFEDDTPIYIRNYLYLSNALVGANSG